MPVTITPVRAATTIQAPIDGEVGDASDLVTTTIQPIANQIRHMNDRVRVGDVAAMAAATGVLAGDIWVTGDLGTYGAFSSSAGLGDFWEVASTGTSGIWWGHVELQSTLRANRGIVRYGPVTGLDTTPNGKIPVAHLTNRFLLSMRIPGVARLDETISASQVLVIPTHFATYATPAVGDIIDGSVGPIRLINQATAPSNAYAYLRIRATDAFGTMSELQAQVGEVIVGPTQDITVTIPFRHVVQTGTSTTIQLVMTSSSSNGMQAIGLDVTDFNIGTMTVHRP